MDRMQGTKMPLLERASCWKMYLRPGICQRRESQITSSQRLEDFGEQVPITIMKEKAVLLVDPLLERSTS